MTVTPSVQYDPAADSDPAKGRLAAYVLSSIFLFLGLVAISLLVVNVASNAVIRAVLDWDPTSPEPAPSIILAFLSEFGIILPILILVAGVAFIGLGFRVRGRHITTGRWAHVAALWLTIGSVGLAFLNAVQGLTAKPDTPVNIGGIVFPLIAAGGFALLYIWLNRSMGQIFRGQEDYMARETRVAWNMLIPTLAVFIVVAARPLEQTFIRSLTDKRFAGQEVPQFVGLENYQSLLGIRLDTVACRWDEATSACVTRKDGSIRWESIDQGLLEAGYRTVWTIQLPFGERAQSLAISSLDDDFLQGIGTTLLFASISVTLELIIALFMAVTVNSEFVGRGLMRAVMLVPWAIPTVISARLWELMLKDTSAGIINRILMDMHLIDVSKAWLSDVSLQIPAAIMVDVWKTAPFMALLLLAGLQTIPSDLYEAASVDGASRVRQFFSVTLPLLRPTIGVALVFRTLDALRVFDLFNVLFGRQQLTMATYDYETLVNNQRDGYASAVSMIIFLLIAVFALIYVRLLNVETD